MFGSLCFYKCADVIQSEDPGGTNDGKYNTVSFRHQAWRFIIAAPSIKGGTLRQIPRGSFSVSIGGSFLKIAEVLPLKGQIQAILPELGDAGNKN